MGTTLIEGDYIHEEINGVLEINGQLYSYALVARYHKSRADLAKHLKKFMIDSIVKKIEFTGAVSVSDVIRRDGVVVSVTLKKGLDREEAGTMETNLVSSE